MKLQDRAHVRFRPPERAGLPPVWDAQPLFRGRAHFPPRTANPPQPSGSAQPIPLVRNSTSGPNAAFPSRNARM